MKNPIVLSILAALAFSPATAAPGWTVSSPGSPINTDYHEAFSAMTEAGLTLYISSDRPGGRGSSEKGVFFLSANYDIYVTHRKSVDAPWGPVVALGPNINTSVSDHSANLSADGHYLYFTSDRPGGFGQGDIYRSYRKDVTDDQGWEAPVNLGAGVNTPYTESCAVIYAEDGDTYLFYIQVPGPAPALPDFRVSKLDAKTNSFLPSRLVEISTPALEGHLDPRHGLIWAAYPGGLGGDDIWRTERIAGEKDLAKSWTKPVNLGAGINTEFAETMPSATSDGRRLVFISDRPGGLGGTDIYEAVRTGN